VTVIVGTSVSIAVLVAVTNVVTSRVVVEDTSVTAVLVLRMVDTAVRKCVT